MLKKFTLILSMLALALVICSSVSAADMTKQVNPNANGDSLNPAISADGGNVTFSSDSSNLVANDTNGKSDIFVVDTQTGAIKRASVSSSGGQSDGNSYNPSITSDGSQVVFDSDATNFLGIVIPDTNRCSDIFLHNMITGTTVRIPFNSTVWQLNGNSYNPSISGNGRYIAYEFYDTTIAGSYGDSSIYLYDSVGHNTTILGSGKNPVVSEDGTCVVYQDGQIYHYNILTGEITVVSVDPYGNEGNAPSFNPSVNSDGKLIAFQSNANNLCSGDTNANSDIFIHDIISGLTFRLSVNSNYEQANGPSFNPSISGVGYYVTYYSFASNLVDGDTNGVSDVFFYDLMSDKTFRVSVDSNDGQFSFGSYLPVISSDGRYVTFLSKSSSSSGYDKVFVRDCAWNANTNIASGDYYAPQSVTFTANDGVNLYYTTDGTDPTTGSTHYTSPITVNTTQTLKYIAVDAASNQSPVSTRTYRIYAWEPYSYQVTIAYRLSNKKYKIKYKVPYKVKKRIGKKVVYVTKYKTKYRWDYHYGYRTETRWAYHWVLK